MDSALSWAPLAHKPEHRKRKVSDGPGVEIGDQDGEFYDEAELLARVQEIQEEPVFFEESTVALNGPKSSASQMKRRLSLSLESDSGDSRQSTPALNKSSSSTGSYTSGVLSDVPISSSNSTSGEANRLSIGGGLSIECGGEGDRLSSGQIRSSGSLRAVDGSSDKRMLFVCGAIFAVILTGIVVALNSNVVAVPMNDGTSTPAEDISSKDEDDGINDASNGGKIFGITLIVLLVVALVIFSLSKIYSHYFKSETVLLARGDDELASVIEKARAEWQAGRFAGEDGYRSPHMVPNAAQRAWATQSIASLEVV